MSAEPYYTIWCDWAGCSNFIQTSFRRVDDARRQAHDEGWQRRYSANGLVDVCPDHTSKVSGS